ncbi:MAG: hydantoinase/oxoprolinase family protein, partial [Gammaproteobacteria bacterium]|nr:hydantoinase/oxoprolinase family protein [Gammaproteobacteria bacterium]
DTANAIGAVLGAVVQMAHITVTQPEFGIYLLFHRDQPLRFDSLEAALSRARDLALMEAENLARSAGADVVETRIREDANHVRHDIDGEFFVSSTVTAIATGRPGNKGTGAK